MGQGEVQREFRNADIYRSTKKVENAEENRKQGITNIQKNLKNKESSDCEKKKIFILTKTFFEFFFYPFVEEEMRKIGEGNEE